MPAPKPTLYVIAGPEGSGKSTFYRTTLKASDRSEFISADTIRLTAQKDGTSMGADAAEKLAENRQTELLAQRKSFSTETTFDKPRDLALVNEAKEKGYRVVLFHLQVRTPDLAVERVAARAREGGHSVPDDRVREGFAKSLPLIRDATHKADLTFVYDTSALNQPPHHLISLERGQLTKAVEHQPLWSRELYAKELRQATPENKNAAAKSFLHAQVLAARAIGQDAHVTVAGHQPGEHRGPIIGETEHHLVQKVGDKEAVAHFKERLAVQPVKMLDLKITYGADRDRGTILFSPQGRDTPAPQKAPELVRAYLAQSREEALKAHPELKPAYAAEDSLRKTIAQSRPANEQVAKQVGDMVRQTIAAKLKDGTAIEINRPLADAVKYQVAHRSLDHVYADKLVHPEQSLRIDPAHRYVLVARADMAMRQGESKMQLAPAAQRAADDAKEIAARIAVIDGPRGDNPFVSKQLGETYKHEQGRQAQDRALSRAATKSLER